MGENFLKAKRKYRLAAFIISGVLSACIGVIAACLLAAIFKPLGIDLKPFYYILIALGACGLAFGILILALLPDDKKVAKKLDEKYGLNQKVQTMVEFSADGGTMATLQREQANEALGAVAKKRIDLSLLLYWLAVPVLAVAMLFLGIFMPAKKQATNAPPPPPPAVKFEITEAQYLSLANLKADINGSALEEGLKGAIVLSLDSLYDELESVNSKEEADAQVLSAVVVIDGLITVKNTYLPIATTLNADEDLKSFALALSNAPNAFIGRGKVSNMTVVAERASTAEADINDVLTTWLTDMGKKLTDCADIDAVADLLLSYSQKLNTALGQYESTLGSAAPDALYNALASFDLETLSASKDSYSQKAAFVQAAENKFRQFAEGALNERLRPQTYNLIIDHYIHKRLADVFAVEIGDMVSKLPNSGNGDEDKPIGPGLGPWGSIEVELGKDPIYDPEQGVTPYGTVLPSYRARVLSKLESQPVDSELDAFIRDYFTLLFTSGNNS